MKTELSLLNLKSTFFIRFIAKPVIPIIVFLLIFTNSCTDPFITSKNTLTVEGGLIDGISHTAVANARVEVLGWYESWFYPGVYYSFPVDSGLTDSYGRFNIGYESLKKYKYSLGMSKSGYFREEYPAGSLRNNVNWVIFPTGNIVTHISSKLSTAKWIEVEFSVTYNSQPFFRNGFQNLNVFSRAFADTAITTTSVGGLDHRLKIFAYYTDNTQEKVNVRDTTVITIPQGTVYLNITLKK